MFRLLISFVFVALICELAFAQTDTVSLLMKLRDTDKEKVQLIYERVAEGYKKDLNLSLQLVDAALELSQRSQLTILVAYGYYHKAKILYEFNRHIEAVSLLKSAATIIRTTKRDTLLTRIYALSADSYAKLTKTDSVFVFRKLQLQEAISFKDSIEIARAYLGTGLAHWGIGENFEAYKNFLTAAEIASKSNNSRAMALAYFNMASIHYRWGDYVKALENYKIVYGISKKIQDEHRSVKVICNIGFMYASMGMYAEADSVYNEATKFAVRNNYNDLITYTYFLKGGLYNKLGRYNDAIAQYTLGLPLFLAQLDHGGYVQALAGLGEAYGKLGYKKKAVELFNKAVYEARNYKDDFSLTIVLLAYANYLVGETNYGLAKSLLREALQVSKNRNIKTSSVGSLFLLADIAEKEGNKIDALRYLLQYDQARDSLFEERSVSALQEFRITYATDKQKVENDVLKRRNELSKAELQRKNLFTIVFASLISVGLFVFFGAFQLSRVRKKVVQETEFQNNQLKELNKKLSDQNEQLSQAIKTRNVMFSILSVDLKQPFITLLGYTDLLVHRFDDMTKKEIVEGAKNINSASLELFNLIVNLFEWSRLQTVGVHLLPSQLNLNELVLKAMYSLQRRSEAKSVQIIFDYQEDCFIYADDSALSLSIRNLLFNAIAHSPEYGKIFIELNNRSGKIALTINEEGSLYSEKDVESLLEFRENEQLLSNIIENSTTLRFVVASRFIELSGGKFMISPFKTTTNEYFISFPCSLQ